MAARHCWAAARASGAGAPGGVGDHARQCRIRNAPAPGFVAPKSLRLRLLNTLALRVMAAGGGARELADTPWNSVVEPSATLLTLSRWRDAWAQLRRVAIPAEDVVLLRLPSGLGILYPVLRLPLWIWKRSPWSPRRRPRRRIAPRAAIRTLASLGDSRCTTPMRDQE